MNVPNPQMEAYAAKLYDRAVASIAAAEKAKEVAAKVPEQELPPAPKFEEGRTYRDPQTGVRKRYVQGQFV